MASTSRLGIEIPRKYGALQNTDVFFVESWSQLQLMVNCWFGGDPRNPKPPGPKPTINHLLMARCPAFAFVFFGSGWIF